MERIYSNYAIGNIDIPLFVTYCHPQLTNIYYLPNPDNMRKAIFEQFITEMIYTIVYRKSFVDPQEFINYMTCFEEVFEQNCDQNSNLNLRIKKDIPIMTLFNRIKKVVDDSYVQIEKFTNELIPIKQNHYKYSMIKLNELNEETKSEDLKDLYQKFLEEDQKIKKLKTKPHVGIFEYNLENLYFIY